MLKPGFDNSREKRLVISARYQANGRELQPSLLVWSTEGEAFEFASSIADESGTVEVDVVVDDFRFQSSSSSGHHSASILGVGSEVRNQQGVSGTNCCFASGGGDTLRGISCNHVLAGLDQGKRGDPIFIQQQVVGRLTGFEKLRRPQPNKRDFASFDILPTFKPKNPVNRLPAPVPAWMTTRQLGSPRRGLQGKWIAKIGMASGYTREPISNVFPDSDPITVSMQGVQYRFCDFLQVESDPGAPFTADGDSGALVFDPALRPNRVNTPVGVHFAIGVIRKNRGTGPEKLRSVFFLLTDTLEENGLEWI